MIKVKSKSVILILFALLIILPLLLLPLLFTLSKQLSKTDRVNANILLVEGWLGDNDIKLAYKEFKEHEYDIVITTGINLISHEYYLMASNGYLIFYPNIMNADTSVKFHSIEVNVFGQPGGDNSPRFNLFVNDSLSGEFTAGIQKDTYKTTWKGRMKDIDSVMIQFTNDALGDFGDRNLFVKEIIIDGQISIPYKFNSVYDIADLDGKDRFVNNFRSYAELAGNRLLSMGLDSSLLIIISADNVRLNRTLVSALAVKKWLQTTDLEVKGINIVSAGLHARRSWMTYKKIIGDNNNVGIITIPDKNTGKKTGTELLNTTGELLSLIYYWFILIPY